MEIGEPSRHALFTPVESATVTPTHAVFGNTTPNIGDVQLGITAAQIGAGLVQYATIETASLVSITRSSNSSAASSCQSGLWLAENNEFSV